MFRFFALLVSGLLLVAGCTATPQDEQSGDQVSPAAPAPEPTPTRTPTPTPTPTPPPELPGGGFVLLPTYRLCGFVGHPHAPGQGRLGIGDIQERMVELHEQCAPYAGGRVIMPVMELIAVTVMPSPGADGMSRARTDSQIIEDWLSVAREHDAMLLLNIQPGHSSFLAELQALEQYLVEPDVGVALDPEWAMSPGQVPMQSFGSTSGEELDEVARYLSGLVIEHDLPEKVMLYHILHPEIISNEAALQAHPGIVLVKSVDGIGAPADKVGTYNRVATAVPPHVFMGFKLFYEEDVQTSGILMTPEEVMGITPVPDYVLYE
ncbi:MAG: hypothetical protein ACOX61_01005 [Brooklawnia sp.]|jgi:hypothetical protein